MNICNYLSLFSIRLGEFTLLEAMSAIEMMDPKMDAGMCTITNNNSNNNNNISNNNYSSNSNNSQATTNDEKKAKKSKQVGRWAAEEAIAEGRLKVYLTTKIKKKRSSIIT